MSLQVTNIKRVFKFKKDGKEIELDDPGPAYSTAEVMKYYSGIHPELTNGFIQGPIVIKDNAIYTMTTKAGTLG